MRKSPSLQNGSPPPKEAKIIAVYNQKGGVGKTMTTMQLSAAFSLRGYKTLVIDMDTQSTATMWSSQASEDKPFPATVVSLAVQSKNMIGELRKFVDMYDFIFVDCRPSLDDAATWAVLHVADVGIIPVIPLLADLWASLEAKEKGLNAQKENPELQLFYLASNVGRGKVYEIGIDTLRDDETVTCLNATLSTRSSFAESQYFGSSVHSLGRRGAAAVTELEALADELLTHIKH